MTTAKNTQPTSPSKSSKADESWQDYLDELRMLDDGCPNCHPAPAAPTMVERQSVNGAQQFAAARWRNRLLRRWPSKLVSETIEVLLKIAIASLFT